MGKARIIIKILRSKELFKKIGKTEDAINNEIKNIITENALLVERNAKLNVTSGAKVSKGVDAEHPVVQTGRLRASITHIIGIEKRKLVAKIGTNVIYAPYLEFGTETMPPYPWLFPALQSVQGKMLKDIKKKIKTSIKNVWKRK